MENKKCLSTMIDLLSAFGKLEDSQVSAYIDRMRDYPGPVIITATQVAVDKAQYRPTISEIKRQADRMMRNIDAQDANYLSGYDGDVNAIRPVR